MNILHQYPCSKHISSKFCTFSKHQYGFIMQMTKMTGSFTEWQKPPPCLYTLPFKEQKLQQQLKKGPSLVRSIFNFFTQLLYTVSVANTHTHIQEPPPASIPLEQYLAMFFLHWLNGLIHLYGGGTSSIEEGAAKGAFKDKMSIQVEKQTRLPLGPPTSPITTRECPDGCIHPELDFWERNGNSVAIGCLEQQPRRFASV